MAISITTAPGTINLSKNPIYVRFTSSSYSGLDNYRVVLRVEFETVYNSGSYTQVAEIESQPNSAGITSFDIQSILDTCLERYTTFQVPDLTAPQPYASDTLRRFRLKYLEKYGTPQEEQALTVSSAYRVLLGGVDRHYFGLYDFFSNLTADNSLLTYIPTGKQIARNQPETLAHIRHQSLTGYYAFLRVRQFAVDGTLISQFDKYRLTLTYDALLFLDTYEPGIFPTGPAALGIDTNAVKYTIQVFAVGSLSTPGGLEESGSPVAASQVYTYYITDEYQEQPSDLIWYNAFRVPQILRCTGQKRNRLQVERSFSEHITSFGYDPVTLSNLQHSREFNNRYAYRSGAMRPDDVDALQELLIENKLLEYNKDGNYYRLRITDNNFDIAETRRSPNYIEFNAERALAPGNYMKLRPFVASAETASLWQQNDNGFWELNTSAGFWQLNS
jgi:hypothetical protein